MNWKENVGVELGVGSVALIVGIINSFVIVTVDKSCKAKSSEIVGIRISSLLKFEKRHPCKRVANSEPINTDLIFFFIDYYFRS